MSFEYTAAFKIAGLDVQILKADDAWIIVEGEKATRVDPTEAALAAHWPQFGPCDGYGGMLIKGENTNARVLGGEIKYFMRADGSGECMAGAPHAHWCGSAGHCRRLAAAPNYAGPYIQENRAGEWVTQVYCAVGSKGHVASYHSEQWAKFETIPMYLPKDVQFPVTIHVNGNEITYPTKYHAKRTEEVFPNPANIALENGIKFKPGSRSEKNMAAYLDALERNRKIHAHIDALVSGKLALADLTITLDKKNRAITAALLFSQLNTPAGVVYDEDVIR